MKPYNGVDRARSFNQLNGNRKNPLNKASKSFRTNMHDDDSSDDDEFFNADPHSLKQITLEKLNNREANRGSCSIENRNNLLFSMDYVPDDLDKLDESKLASLPQ